MKFFSNGYDTYAAENLDDIKSEMIAARIIDEEDFEPEEWEEVDQNTKAWVIDLADIDKSKYKNDQQYKNEMQAKYLKTLDAIFREYEPPSETGKAFFICTTEY